MRLPVAADTRVLHIEQSILFEVLLYPPIAYNELVNYKVGVPMQEEREL